MPIQPQTQPLMTALIALCLVLSATSLAHAGQVSKVSKNKALLTIDQEELQPGDRIFTLDENGKKRGIVEIEKVSNQRALGKIVRGKVTPGMGLMTQGGSSGRKAKAEEKSSHSSSGDSNMAGGVLLGLGIDSMTVELADAAGNPVEKLNMSGTGFSAKGYLDYDFVSYFGMRILLGLEQFTANGTASAAICDGTDQCKTQIMYFTFDGLLRYSFVDDKDLKIWIGGGVGYWMPSSKTTNTLDEKSIGSTTAGYVSAGADFGFGDLIVPVQADYIILPSTSQVAASGIAIRAGFGVRF